MEIRQLQHLVALAEEGTFTAAARRERIVQSGLSSSIQALERDVEAVLYVRGSRPVRLTPAGEALLEPARAALADVERARRRVQDASGTLDGPLRVGLTDVGVLESACPFVKWLAGFVGAHPGVVVHATQPEADAALAQVASGALDCAVVAAAPVRAPGVRMRTLASESLVLVCSAAHDLARRDRVALTDIVDESFVDLRPDAAGRRSRDAFFADRGVSRRVTCEVSDLTMVRELVAAGLGVGFLPAPIAADQRLATVRLAEPVPEQSVCLVLPTAARTSPSARALDRYVSERLDEASGTARPSRISVEI
jgi:DNA-binding transcriptional LysR family regulator